MAIKITMIIALILTYVIPFGAYVKGEKNKGRYTGIFA